LPATPDDLVAEAREAIAKGSKSFALASKLFDPATRERAWLLYAWCRHCDDMIDGQLLGYGHIEPAADIDTRLGTMTRLTKAALAGERTGIAPFDALRRVAAETRLPERYPMELIAGFGMDAADRVYRSFDDTLEYCYHVAGVVGVMMAIVMGVSPDDRATLERASDLGIAFQLANIVRDVVDDDRLGRCYLPAEWLTEANIPPGEHAHPAYRDGLARVAARMVDEAERYEASSRHGTPELGFRSAWAVLSAAKIYGDIGRRVRALGPRAWDRRVSTSKAEKLASVVVGLGEATTRRRWRTSGPRGSLWTMP
jgi:phytoene synthase